MRVILRSPPPRPKARSQQLHLPLFPAPALAVSWSSPWEEFLGNLLAALEPSRPARGQWRDIFPELFLAPWRPRRSLATSALVHVAVLLMVWNTTPFGRWVRKSTVEQEAARDALRITWYRYADELPAISPQKGGGVKPAPAGGRRRGPSPRGASEFHPQQVIISNPPKPDNARQTIYQPDAPNVRMTHDVRLPNIVIWREVEKPLPPVDLVKRPVARLIVPAALLAKNVDLPEEVPNLERRISDLKMAASNLASPNPKLPVPPATPVAGNAPATPQLPPPPPPAAVTGAGASQENQLRRLIAIGVNPTPPGGPVDVPPGNRAGSFSIAPAGKTPGTPYGKLAGLEAGAIQREPDSGEPDSGERFSLAGAVGPAPAGEGSGEDPGAGGGAGAGVRNLAEISVPGLSVSGGVANPGPGPIVTGPPPAASGLAPFAVPARPKQEMPSPLRPSNDKATLLAHVTRPQLPEWNHASPREEGFSASKKVYTLYINMPNLTSGSGSWILRFAELEDRQPAIELAAPVPVRKVDPGYEPSAVRDKVQGLVVLRAVIRKDGRVEHIEVIRGLDPRLDQRAIQAFERWEFQPATRNGTPVDLEAVVQVPFMLLRAIP